MRAAKKGYSEVCAVLVAAKADVNVAPGHVHPPPLRNAVDRYILRGSIHLVVHWLWVGGCFIRLLGTFGPRVEQKLTEI